MMWIVDAGVLLWVWYKCTYAMQYIQYAVGVLMCCGCGTVLRMLYVVSCGFGNMLWAW